MIDIEKLKKRCGYDGKPQQWQYGFDLACRELAKAQAVPEGFVLVEKNLIKTLHEELLDHEPDSFVVNRDICELWEQAEAQEPTND